MLKQLKVSELIPGMMVTQVIEQNGPVKIRKVGFIRSADMIRGLSEMGVSVVEVDLNESLHVEPDSDDNNGGVDDSNTHSAVMKTEAAGNTSAANASPAKSTATQRLVASNRQIADVDRQLSQQFHRSLFLPAVDQMPSKWMLYGKPYTLLLLFVLSGFAIGAFASNWLYGAFYASDSSQLNRSGNEIEAPRLAPAGSSDMSTSETGGGANANIGQTNLSKPDEPNAANAGNTADASRTTLPAQNMTDSASNTASPTSADVNIVDASQNTQPVSQEASTNTASQESNRPVSAGSINGVELEAGQQVLGYQSGNDSSDFDNDSDNSNDNDNNNNTRNTSERSANNTNQSGMQSRANRSGGDTRNDSANDQINPTLLRRIQAAAQDVDDQADEPEQEVLRVTDLNALPRIDQLSPAVLTQMPAMSFSAHMYASNPRDRWVRVNSRRLGEGDIIANNVMLKRIESEKVVLEYNGTEFTMNALSDW